MLLSCNIHSGPCSHFKVEEGPLRRQHSAVEAHIYTSSKIKLALGTLSNLEPHELYKSDVTIRNENGFAMQLCPRPMFSEG